ncbi:MAG: GDP-L-fucose synthase [Bacteroidales bacterium]|nr:GDP-L-fucose synthase [Bacteroidales bacterium]
MNLDSKIFVAGHRGLVGSAILKNLKEKGYHNFVLRSHNELDLCNQAEVEKFFAEQKPEYVFLAAAFVGGIMANSKYRADFIYNNLQIQNNVIHFSYKYGVKKLLFLGSTCIYPREALQPMQESELLTNELEYTNEPYALAKIAGLKMCESYNLQYGTNFIAVMPTNLYGLNDNFNLETSHVMPALIRKAFLGKCLQDNNWESLRKDLNTRPIEGVNGESEKSEIEKILSKYGIKSKENSVEIELWGSGTPLREFLWSEDMADACVFLMEKVDFKDTFTKGEKEIKNCHINIGTQKEISIKDLFAIICQTVGYTSNIIYNSEKPDGTMRKLTDCTKLHSLGWKHKIELPQGVQQLYDWYLESIK